MPPAARITDMHVCPMVTPGVPPIPHVGGPILPPGAPTVLIGFLPAATVTGMATCVGPPDIIAKGSAGVFINFLPAARMGDTCAHGGTIVLGEPTVMIGEVGSPAPGAGGAGAVMAGLVVAGLVNPANSGTYSAVLSAAGAQGTAPSGDAAGTAPDEGTVQVVPNTPSQDSSSPDDSSAGSPPPASDQPADDESDADASAGDGDAADQPAVMDESMAQNAKPAEQLAAQRLADSNPEFNGRTFTAPPPPDPGHDWTDDKGKTYDAMGDGTKSELLDLDKFKRSIIKHLRKGNDYTIIDLTGYTPDQIKAIAQFVDSLTPAQQATIRKLGF